MKRRIDTDDRLKERDGENRSEGEVEVKGTMEVVISTSEGCRVGVRVKRCEGEVKVKML